MNDKDPNETSFLASMGLSSDLDKLREDGRKYRQREDMGCSDCDYSGFTINSEGKSVLCRCTKRKMHEKLCIEACIPRMFWGASMSDWNIQQNGKGEDLGSQRQTSSLVRATVSYYCKHIVDACSGHPWPVRHAGGMVSKLHSLKLEGGDGSGKTFLVSVVLQEALKQGLSAYYIDWANLVYILSTFDKSSEQDEIFDIFSNYDIVAIDQVTFTGEKYPGHCVRNLDRVCRARLNSGKPVLLGVTPGWDSIDAGNGLKALASNCLRVSLPNMNTGMR